MSVSEHDAITQALRFNDGKRKLSMVFEMPDAIDGVTRVLEFGAEKYARCNYVHGLPYTEVVDSTLRHLMCFINGEQVDKESGLHHVHHAACNLLFLSQYVVTNHDKDDRLALDNREPVIAHE
jgi:hypothetical protein